MPHVNSTVIHIMWVSWWLSGLRCVQCKYSMCCTYSLLFHKLFCHCLLWISCWCYKEVHCLLLVDLSSLEQNLSLPEFIFFCLLWCTDPATISVKRKLTKIDDILLKDVLLCKFTLCPSDEWTSGKELYNICMFVFEDKYINLTNGGMLCEPFSTT